MVKNPPTNAGDIRDVGLITGLERCPGGGHGNPLQYSYLENPMDREAWQVTIHRVAKSRTRLKLYLVSMRKSPNINRKWGQTTSWSSLISISHDWVGWLEADSPERTPRVTLLRQDFFHCCCCCFKDSLFAFASVHSFFFFFFFCHAPWHVGSCFPTKDGTVPPALKVQSNHWTTR